MLLKKKKRNTKKLIIICKILISFVFSCVFSAFLTQFVPTIFIGKYQVEFLGLVLISFSLLLYFLFRHRKLYIATLLVFCLFFVFMLVGNIGWNGSMVANNAKNNVIFLFGNRGKSFAKVDILPSQKNAIPHISLQQRIQRKVDYKDSVVRTFAVEHSLIYFDEYYTKYRQICRQFSLIKYIKDNYKYVSDPSDFDYFASPQESIQLMGGDCDDYSILLASTLKAIGCNVRIVWAPRHVYPEMYCGDKNSFEKYVNAIYTFFPDEIANKPIYYRIDKNQNYWLNIDYTDKYPGSSYLSEEVLSIIYIK